MNKSIWLGVVRHLLTTAGGMVAASGTFGLEADEVQQLVGAVMVLVGGVWSVYEKLVAKRDVVVSGRVSPVIASDDIAVVRDAEVDAVDLGFKSSGFTLSDRSRGNLEGVNPLLARIVETAIKMTPVDFAVTEGLRSVERQKELVAAGKSWVVALHLAQWLSPKFAVQVTNWVHDWMNGKSDQPVTEAVMPLASCTPIMYQGQAVLMLHRTKKDWVCFRSLCEVTGLDYRYHARMARESGLAHATIEQTGEKVFCITYKSALDWLAGINPEKIRLNKRHKVVSAMLQLPKLLTVARDAYRAITKALPSPSKLLPKGRAALLEALEKIEGHRLVVMPCEAALEFNKKYEAIQRMLLRDGGALSLELLDSGFTLKSLRGLA